MTTQLSTTKRICEHLEKYVFDRVWNEPYTQYRSYIKPELLSKNVELDNNGVPKKDRQGEVLYRPYFAAGFFPSRYGSILLPPYSSDEELMDWLPKNGLQFAVYSVPASFFGSTVLNIPNWTLFSTYCTKNHLDLQMFTTEGICLNRGYIYIKQADQNDCMLVAVESNMYRKLVGDIGKYDETGVCFPHADDMIFGKYFDSDETADNKVGFARLTASQLPKIRSMATIGRVALPTGKGESVKIAEADYVTKNGMLCVGDYSSLIQAKDYVEAVVDEDILGVVDVELKDELIYIDQETEDPSIPPTNERRLLIHIPKALNPEYRLITPDTCGLWVYPTGKDCTEGLHLYACDRVDKFHQITHSDFSISTSLLSDIATLKGWEGITVRVYVRTHGHSSMFIRDGHYIDFLYNLDDDDIIKMLLGEHSWQTVGDPKLLFWKADFLESSKYADALLRRRCKEQTLVAIDEEDFSTDLKQWCKRDNYADNPVCRGQCSVCGINALCPHHQAGDPIKTYMCPFYTSRSIQDYIDILGYFHVLALIGKRIFHYRVTKAGTQSVVVSVPLALSYPELETEDYYPVVYHNGVRVDQCDVSWHETCSTNTDVREIDHNDIETVQAASIISANYSTRLKVSINKVYRETKDHTFRNDVRYYKTLGDQYVRALVVEATPVKVVEEDFDDNGERGRLALNFEDDVVYFARIDREYRKLVKGVDYNPGESMLEFVENNNGHMLFTGSLIGLDPNELACLDGVVGDITSAEDMDPIYELKNDVKLNDTISVELFDRRHKGSFEILHMGDHQEEAEVKHKFATLDSWEIYMVGTTEDIDGSTKNVYTPMDPEDLGVFDRETYTFTFFPAIVAGGEDYLIMEGPNTVEDSQSFEIVRGGYHDTSYFPGTTGIIGEKLWKENGAANQLAIPLDSELVFINNKRLIPNLDYITSGYETIEGAKDTITVYGQCVSYLQEQNELNVIRTNTTVIPYSVQRGFVIGSHISWKGQTPIWFDELSTLVVDGKLVANYKQMLGEMTLNPVKCRNGATYEVKTSVSTMIKDIMDYDEAMEEDLRRIEQIHEFFIEDFELPDMTAIIPHSHRLYSIFLEAIISKYLTDESYEITRLKDCANIEAYKKQFLDNTYFKALYDLDVIYDKGKMLDYYLNFIDVYGIYHPLVAKYREDYDTLRELCEVFLPEDNIKHKETKK